MTDWQGEPGVGGVFVQYGCGWTAPAEWLNFDASPTLRLERLPVVGRWCTRNPARFPDNVRYGDIVSGLPVADGSVDGLFASHVLEHLSRADCDRALVNSYRMLKSGGVFRLVVPDLLLRAQRYVAAAEAGDSAACHSFMTDSGLGRETRPSGLVSRLVDAFGLSRHLWMWDEAGLRMVLEQHGFRRIRRCRTGDADHAAFALVEQSGRFFDAVGRPELALEAIRE
ncbi:methyltransferase domain-containing protein [Azospirillum sp.]|uniref:class I SAM-dependent methyltransferase n=1 Tax=Azospirillum sp. TaxID=34012 RepID=UPI002606567D|nr:methyltransferase domain-containing protein [Azospirillum sp.]